MVVTWLAWYSVPGNTRFLDQLRLEKLSDVTVSRVSKLARSVQFAHQDSLFLSKFQLDVNANSVRVTANSSVPEKTSSRSPHVTCCATNPGPHSLLCMCCSHLERTFLGSFGFTQHAHFQIFDHIHALAFFVARHAPHSHRSHPLDSVSSVWLLVVPEPFSFSLD